jgi:hypothetical protein
VHVTRPGGPAGAAAIALAAQRQLTESIGGAYHQQGSPVSGMVKHASVQY